MSIYFSENSKTVDNNIKNEKKNKNDSFSKNNNKTKIFTNSNTINNKNDKIYSTNNNNKNITSNNNSNQSLNTLIEFEFLYSDSHFNKKINKNKNEKNTNKTKNYTTLNNTSFNIDQKNSFDSKIEKKLIKIKLNDKKYKNKRSSRQNKLKKNISHNSFDIFLQRVKLYQTKKETNIKNMRSESLKSEFSEIMNHPSISDNSLLILKKIKREPLYQKKPLNEEKSLDKKFNSFYLKNFDDANNNNSKILKSPIKYKTIDEKFSKFYEEKMKWKKNIELINNAQRDYRRQRCEEKIKNNSFTPLLDKNSIKIVNKMNRYKSIDYDMDIINTYYCENQKELINKFKVKLKPIINNYYNNNKKYTNKRSAFLQRTKSDIFSKRIYNNYDFENKQIGNKKNYKLNYKINEKKYKNIRKKEKKDEKNNKTTNKKDKIERSKDYDLRTKIKELQKNKEAKKKGLYKLNIQQGTAWNQEVINNIYPRRNIKYIIEDLL
jgi:hypothetical protein